LASSLKPELTRGYYLGFSPTSFYEKLQRTRTSENENARKSNNYIYTIFTRRLTRRIKKFRKSYGLLHHNQWRARDRVFKIATAHGGLWGHEIGDFRFPGRVGRIESTATPNPPRTSITSRMVPT